MFAALRKMVFPIIIIVLLFFGGMIVLEWGAGLSSRSAYDNPNLAAVINGEEVDWQTYNRIYNSLYQQEAQQVDEELSDQKLEQIQQTAWQQLLADRLLMQEAEKRDITVTDEEVYQFLRFSPPPEIQQYFVGENGQFDYQQYLGAMVDPQFAPFWNQLTPSIKSDIKKLKVQEMIIQTAHVTEAEIKDQFLASTEKIKVGMINVDYNRFSRPPPRSTDEELQAFFDERKDEYTVDERASLAVALIEKEPSNLDWEAGYKRIEAIRDSIVDGGQDFFTMAQIHSDDGSAEKGGDLGWFGRGQMVAEFERTAFSMTDSGQVSEPVRTRFGWHILQYHGRHTIEKVPRGKTEKEPVEEVHASHILIKVRPSRETLDNMYRQMEEFLAAAKNSGFDKAGQDLKINVQRTGFFFKGRNIPILGSDPQANEFAFTAKLNEISPVMDNNSAVYVLQVDERREAGPATFDEAKEKVKLDIVKWKVQTICEDTMSAIYSKIQDGTSLERAAKAHGEEYETTDLFTRQTYVKGLGRDPVAIGAAFALDTIGQVSAPVDWERGVVVFELLERESPDLTAFTAQRDSIAAELKMAKQQELYGRWFQTVVDNSEIVNNVERTLEASREDI